MSSKTVYADKDLDDKLVELKKRYAELLSEHLVNEERVNSYLTRKLYAVTGGLTNDTVVFASLYHQTLTINVGSNRIEIFKAATYGNKHEYHPELSWFSSHAKSSDTVMLDYLYILGKVAQDMKDPNGFCNTEILTAIIDLELSSDKFEEIDSEMDNVKRQMRDRDKLK